MGTARIPGLEYQQYAISLIGDAARCADAMLAAADDPQVERDCARQALDKLNAARELLKVLAR